jgi:hypothetical protein
VVVFIGAVKWQRIHARQERLCTPRIVGQFEEIVPTESAALSLETLRPFVQQPFFFLGEGRQCEAYESADGRFVIKFFKHTNDSRKEKQLHDSVVGAYIAKTVAPEETGVVACSLGAKIAQLPTVTVLTKRGKIEKIRLHDRAFLFQKRAQPLKQTIMKLVAEKRIKEAASRIQSVFILLARLRDKQVLDRDGALIRNGNIGFVGNSAILLDTGKLSRFPDRHRQTLHDINRLKPLQSWLESACPELVSVFLACQQTYQKADVK